MKSEKLLEAFRNRLSNASTWYRILSFVDKEEYELAIELFERLGDRQKKKTAQQLVFCEALVGARRKKQAWSALKEASHSIRNNEALSETDRDYLFYVVCRIQGWLLSQYADYEKEELELVIANPPDHVPIQEVSRRWRALFPSTFRQRSDVLASLSGIPR